VNALHWPVAGGGVVEDVGVERAHVGAALTSWSSQVSTLEPPGVSGHDASVAQLWPPVDLGVAPQRELDLAERRDDVVDRLLGLVHAAVVGLSRRRRRRSRASARAVAAGRYALGQVDGLAVQVAVDP
jgi:hypothetical protein